MKRILFIYIIILILYSPFSYGHSGRTDSRGGHNETATGDYHFHHGFSAHYHINGICPFLNENKTVSSNKNTSSENRTVSSNKSSLNEDGISANILLPVIGIGGFGIFILSTYEKNKKRMKIKIENEIRENKFQEEKEYYSNLYSDRSAIELANVPAKITFDENKLPIIQDNSEHKWGRVYTVYISKTGKSYHQTKGCSSSSRPIHIFRASAYKLPCKRCVKNRVEIPSWYRQYVEICNIKDKYKI